MGQTASEHAERLANLAPAPAAAPERGHRRGRDYIDRSRTDGWELRGVPFVGHGITGAMPGTRPGDSVAKLERDQKRDESELAKQMMRRARGNLKRARRADYQP